MFLAAFLATGRSWLGFQAFLETNFKSAADRLGISNGTFPWRKEKHLNSQSWIPWSIGMVWKASGNLVPLLGGCGEMGRFQNISAIYSLGMFWVVLGTKWEIYYIIGVNRSASSASQQKRGQTVLVCLSISVFYFWPTRNKLEAGAWVLVRMWQDLNAFHRIHQVNQWVDQVVQAPLSTDMPFKCEIRTKYPTTGNWPTTIWLTGFGFDSLSPSPTNNATTQEKQKSTQQAHPTSSNHIQLKLQIKKSSNSMDLPISRGPAHQSSRAPLESLKMIPRDKGKLIKRNGWMIWLK